MGSRNCDNCKEKIEKEKEHILRSPDDYCKHCDSELFSEKHFCSKDCVIAWLKKD